MKSAAVAVLSVIGTVAVAGIGYGTYQAATPATTGYAQVVNVEPIVKTWQEPEEVCRQVTVQQKQPAKDKNRITGSAIGAAIGGVVGHQFGGGSGKDWATAGGAIAGGVAGNKVQKDMQEKNTRTTTQERCNTVMKNRSRTEGYEVTYRFNDQQDTLRMEQKPGERLPVENGEVVTP